MERDIVLNPKTFQKILWALLPTTQINSDYGFTYIKSEAVAQNFSLNSCSENFRQFNKKITVVEISNNS